MTPTRSTSAARSCTTPPSGLAATRASERATGARIGTGMFIGTGTDMSVLLIARLRLSGGITPASAGTYSRQHRLGRCEQDLDVVPDRAGPGVAKIEAHHLVESGAAASGGLPESRDAGLRVEHAAAVPGF